MIKEKKFYTGRYDRVFKSIFCSEDSKDLMKGFLEKLLNIEIENLIFLNNELKVDSTEEREKRVDVLVKLKDDYLHIELNTSRKDYIHNRNFAFFTKFFATETKIGDEYDVHTKFLHIDLSYNLRSDYKTGDIKNEYYTMTKDCSKYVKNFEIIEYDMDLLRDKWYNMSEEEQEEYKYLMMLDLNKDELRNLSSKGDKIIMKYEEKVNELNDNERFASLMTWEEDQRKMYNTDMHYARDEGKRENQISTARQLIKNGVDMDIISNSTGLSIEELEKIDEDNENADHERFASLMTWEEDQKKMYNTDMHYARDEGIEIGTRNTQVATVKEMLKKDFNISLISEITKLPVEEIEALNNEEE